MGEGKGLCLDQLVGARQQEYQIHWCFLLIALVEQEECWFHSLWKEGGLSAMKEDVSGGSDRP